MIRVALSISTAIAALPQFPLDWSSNQESFLLVKQGDFTIDDKGSFCCPQGSNCNVQTEYQNGIEYFSYTTNQTRFDDDVSGQVIITDYVIGKEMAVQSKTNLTCVEYCPVEFPLDPYAVDKSAVDKGTVTIGGKQYEDFYWEEKILIKIVMEKIDIFVDQSDPKNPVPYIERDELTPFGQDLGTANTTFANFKPGKQDPSLFAVQGAAHCKESPNCGDNARQLNRIRNRDFHAFHLHRSKKH